MHEHHDMPGPKPLRALLIILLSLLASSTAGAGSLDLLVDINTGSASSGPGSFVPFGDHVMFLAGEEMFGTSLWQTDGTADGTRRIVSVPIAQNPRLTAVGNLAYFYALDSYNEYDIWRTDGTASGTYELGLARKVRNLLQFCDGWVAEVRGGVVFGVGASANYGIWLSDGTRDGTIEIKEIPGSNACRMTHVGGQVLFEMTTSAGRELWRTDGTPEGTALVKDINPTGSAFAEAISFVSHAPSFTVMKDVAYFKAKDGATGYELWRSDGTDEGTYLVTDLAPGPLDGVASEPVTLGDRVLFLSTFAVATPGLYVSDGSGGATQLLAADVSGAIVNAGKRGLVLGKDVLVTDGTAVGTTRFPFATPNLTFLNVLAVTNDGVVYFRAQAPSHEYQLWITDGTPSGTRQISDLGAEVFGIDLSLPEHPLVTALASLVGTELFTIRNQRPTAHFDFVTVAQGQRTSLDVLANDVDPDGDLSKASVRIVEPPEHGTVQISGRQLEYTPSSSFKSTDAFAYVVVDDFGATSDPTWATLIMEKPAGNANPPTRSGGGGALSWLEIWMLAIGVCLRRLAREAGVAQAPGGIPLQKARLVQ